MEVKRIMNVDDFANYVAEHLFDSKPEMAINHRAEIYHVAKNNGVILTGIIVKENEINISPTIYVNGGYEKFVSGESLDELVDGYLETYENSRISMNFPMELFMDFAKAKERLAMKLVNREQNEKFLMDVPHFVLGDLAIIFQIQLEDEFLGDAVVTVKEELKGMWGVSTETLYKLAKRNMLLNQPVIIQPMMDLLAEMMCFETPDEWEDEPRMWVMCNEKKHNAASGIVFTDKLQTLAEKCQANLVILPSSIHELIILPDLGQMEISMYSEMVSEINQTLPSEEVLSNTVYYYDREMGELMIAETKEVIRLKEVA